MNVKHIAVAAGLFFGPGLLFADTVFRTDGIIREGKVGKIDEYWVELTPEGEVRPEKLRRSKVQSIRYDDGRFVQLTKDYESAGTNQPKPKPYDPIDRMDFTIKPIVNPSLLFKATFGINGPTGAAGLEFEAQNQFVGLSLGGGGAHAGIRFAVTGHAYVSPRKISFDAGIFHTFDPRSGSRDYYFSNNTFAYAGFSYRVPLASRFSYFIKAGYSHALAKSGQTITFTKPVPEDEQDNLRLMRVGGFSASIGISISIM